MDGKLVKNLFGCDPLDWARYPDGKLVFLNAAGQKFSHSKDELAAVKEKLIAEKTAAKSIAKHPERKPVKQPAKKDPKNKAAGAAAKK